MYTIWEYLFMVEFALFEMFYGGGGGRMTFIEICEDWLQRSGVN